MIRKAPSTVPLLLVLALLAPLAAGAQSEKPAKIGIIDVQRILTDSAPGKDALAKVKQLRDAKQAEATSRQQEISALNQKINDGRLSLAEDKIAELQKQAEDKMTDYKRFEDDAQKELQRRQEEAFDAIEKRVNPIITDVGKAGGYTVILRKFESGLVYADDSIDVTEAIIQKLNSAKPN